MPYTDRLPAKAGWLHFPIFQLWFNCDLLSHRVCSGESIFAEKSCSTRHSLFRLYKQHRLFHLWHKPKQTGRTVRFSFGLVMRWRETSRQLKRACVRYESTTTYMDLVFVLHSLASSFSSESSSINLLKKNDYLTSKIMIRIHLNYRFRPCRTHADL